MAIEDEPQHDHDDCRPKRLERKLRNPDGFRTGKGAANDPLPYRTRLGAAKRIGFAAGKDCRHPSPEELRGKRCHEGRDADLGDQNAVRQSDDQSRGKARKDGKPAEIVFLEQHRKDEARKGDDRGKGEIDLAGPDNEGKPDCKKNERRKVSREKGRVDEGLQENLRRRVYMNNARSITNTRMIGKPSNC